MPTCAIPAVARRPLLAFTPGEPAGIGPDLAVLLTPPPAADVVIIGDPELLAQRAALRQVPWNSPRYQPGAVGISVLPVALRHPVRAGRLDPRNAAYVLDCLRRAAGGCQAAEFDALVTGPVHKAVINDGGYPFTGHTEFLAHLAGDAEVVMMLATRRLRVALLTTHIPLQAVPAALTATRLEAALTILDRALRQDFGLTHPRLAVLGLNPHAGEGGHLGREEIDIIVPVLARLRAAGCDVQGPLPADTAFVAARLATVDAVLALYHDQGLPVLKAQGFGEAVNITLGLPFIRTSVDHGTALDRAGCGAIDGGSLDQALAMAATLVAVRARS
ncbi:MAG: 4-hydroxythreonine-4-phosphate dehydrogenase PdxA [Acidiferrobacter sp.]